MSIFTDHTNLNKAASRVARAQARFDAVVKQVQMIMKPLHDELTTANEDLKKILLQTAKDEEGHILVDLQGLLNAGQLAAVAQSEAARAAVLPPVSGTAAINETAQ